MYLITGVTGQVGSLFANILKNSNEKFIGFNSKNLDIKNYFLVKKTLLEIRKKNIDEQIVLVNAAAVTDVDFAEKNYKTVWEINFEGVKNLSLVCEELDIRFIQISTDYVFSGNKNSPYKVDDGMDPIQAYGASKAGAELWLKSQNENNVIVRTSLVFSGKEVRADYVTRVKNKFAENKDFFMVDDQKASATYAPDLIDKIIKIANNSKLSGIFHIVNEGVCSRYELALEIAKSLNLNHDLMKPISINKIKTFAKRPKYSVLDTSRLVESGIGLLSDWKTALVEAIDTN